MRTKYNKNWIWLRDSDFVQALNVCQLNRWFFQKSSNIAAWWMSTVLTVRTKY